MLSALLANAQHQAAVTADFDTTNLVIRVCAGDLPGQQRVLAADYYTKVCAYTYNEDKLVTFTLIQFDLFYIPPSGEDIDSATAKGTRFSPRMLHMISKNLEQLNCFFFDNVFISNNKGEIMKICGRRPILKISNSANKPH